MLSELPPTFASETRNKSHSYKKVYDNEKVYEKPVGAARIGIRRFTSRSS